MQITPPSLYRCTHLQYRFAVTSEASSICTVKDVQQIILKHIVGKGTDTRVPGQSGFPKSGLASGHTCVPRPTYLRQACQEQEQSLS